MSTIIPRAAAGLPPVSSSIDRGLLARLAGVITAVLGALGG